MHGRRGPGVQADERAPAIVGILAALDEVVALELRRQLARSRQRQPELERELADRALAARADVGEHRDVAAAERWLAARELQELGRGAAPRPEPAGDPPEQRAQLGQLGRGGASGNSYRPGIVIVK